MTCRFVALFLGGSVLTRLTWWSTGSVGSSRMGVVWRVPTRLEYSKVALCRDKNTRRWKPRMFCGWDYVS